MKPKTFLDLFTKCLTVFVIVAAPLAITAQSKKDREKAKSLQEAADKAFVQKNFREAADEYGQAIILVPTNPYAHFRKGFSHFNLKEPDQAITEFTIALSQGFRPLEVYRLRAVINYQQKNYDAAIDDIKKALVLAPGDLLFLKGLGEVYLAKNAFPDALDAFQKAVAVAPNDAEIYFNMTRIYFALNDPKAQTAAAGSALAKGTKSQGEAYFLLADGNRRLKNIPAAIDAYIKALNVKPDLYQAYRNLADVYRAESRYDDAINISKQGLKLFPNDGNIYTDLSWYYSLGDRPADAVDAAKEAIRLLPNQYIAYTNLCRAYNESGKPDLAISACNTALMINPGDGETFYYLGRSNDALGKTAEADSYFKRAVAGLVDFTTKNPDYSDGFYLLGNAYLSDRQRDKALEAYNKCLALSPRFVKAKVNLGLVYVFKKNKALAMEQYNQLMTIDPVYAAKLKAEIDKI